jgi:hypothetical protein
MRLVRPGELVSISITLCESASNMQFSHHDRTKESEAICHSGSEIRPSCGTLPTSLGTRQRRRYRPAHRPDEPTTRSSYRTRSLVADTAMRKRLRTRDGEQR